MYVVNNDLKKRDVRIFEADINYVIKYVNVNEFRCSRNLFSLACQMGTWQEFMALYDKLVPNVYVPEPNIVEVYCNSLSFR